MQEGSLQNAYCPQNSILDNVRKISLMFDVDADTDAPQCNFRARSTALEWLLHVRVEIMFNMYKEYPMYARKRKGYIQRYSENVVQSLTYSQYVQSGSKRCYAMLSTLEFFDCPPFEVLCGLPNWDALHCLTWSVLIKRLPTIAMAASAAITTHITRIEAIKASATAFSKVSPALDL
jgi:hypothetical protein